MSDAEDHKREYIASYKKQHLKRVPLDIQQTDYDAIKAYTEKNHETVNGYIKRLIKEDMQRNSDK